MDVVQTATLLGTHEATNNSGCAEAALTSGRGFKRLHPLIAKFRTNAINGGYVRSRHARHGGDTADAWFTINENRAGTALTLRSTPVLDRIVTENLAQGVKQGALDRNSDRLRIEAE
jgi:hypothetical protein